MAKEEKTKRKIKVRGYRRKDGTIVKPTVRVTSDTFEGVQPAFMALEELDHTRRKESYKTTGRDIGTLIGGGAGGALGSTVTFPLNIPTGGIPIAVGVGAGATAGYHIGSLAGEGVFEAKRGLHTFRPSVRRKLNNVDKDINRVTQNINKSDNPTYRDYLERGALKRKRSLIEMDFSRENKKGSNKLKRVKVKAYRRADGTVVNATIRDYTGTDRILAHMETGGRIGGAIGTVAGGVGGGVLGYGVTVGNPIGTVVGSGLGGGTGGFVGNVYGQALGAGVYETRMNLNKLRPSTRKKLRPINKKIRQADKVLAKKSSPSLMRAREDLYNQRFRVWDDFSKAKENTYNFTAVRV